MRRCGWSISKPYATSAPQPDQHASPGLVLPEGNGALSYSLEPEIPALTFDAATRVLSGTPTTVSAAGTSARQETPYRVGRLAGEGPPARRKTSGAPSRFRHAAGRPKSVAPSGDTTSRTACAIIRSSRTAPILVQALPPWLT